MTSVSLLSWLGPRHSIAGLHICGYTGAAGGNFDVYAKKPMHPEYIDSILRSRLEAVEKWLSFENGESHWLLFTRVGPDLYRLENSPLPDDSVPVYGDIIRVKETADGELLFVEIVERSKLTTQEFVLGEALATERLQSLLNSVMEAGGMWERVLGGVLIVHTPPGIAKMVSEEITSICRR